MYGLKHGVRVVNIGSINFHKMGQEKEQRR